eukprot:205320-Lingulodinium_polyedra.AAC.1
MESRRHLRAVRPHAPVEVAIGLRVRVRHARQDLALLLLRELRPSDVHELLQRLRPRCRRLPAHLQRHGRETTSWAAAAAPHEALEPGLATDSAVRGAVLP